MVCFIFFLIKECIYFVIINLFNKVENVYNNILIGLLEGVCWIEVFGLGFYVLNLYKYVYLIILIILSVW